MSQAESNQAEADRCAQVANSLRGRSPHEVLTAFQALQPGERRTLVRTSYFDRLGALFTGGPEDQQLFDLITADDEGWAALAASGDLGSVYEHAGPPLRDAMTTRFLGDRELLRAVAASHSFDDVARSAPVDAQRLVDAMTREPVALRAIAASSCIFATAEHLLSARRLFEGISRDPEARRRLCGGGVVGAVGDHQPYEVTAPLMNAIVGDPVARLALARSDDIVTVLGRWQLRPADYLAQFLADDAVLIEVARDRIVNALSASPPPVRMELLGRITATAEGRVALAANRHIPEILDTLAEAEATIADLWPLFTDPASRAALVANTEVGQALLRIVPPEIRREIAAGLLRTTAATDCARYAIERATGEGRPEPPRVAVEVAKYWRAFVDASRPDQQAEAEFFELLLTEVVADALFSPERRANEEGDLHLPHELRLSCHDRPCSELYAIAEHAGLVVDDEAFIFERDGDGRLSMRDNPDRRPPLFPDGAYTHVAWQGAHLQARRHPTNWIDLGADGKVIERSQAPPNRQRTINFTL